MKKIKGYKARKISEDELKTCRECRETHTCDWCGATRKLVPITRPAPKLPEGYRVEVTKIGLELWHFNSSYCLVIFNDGVFCFNPVYPKDARAVIAFLQGAR